MDPTTLALLTHALVGLGVWAGLIAGGIFGNMFRGKKRNGYFRRSDVAQFCSLIAFTFITFFVVFIWPGLIYVIPSGITVIVVGAFVPLVYLTEKHIKDWLNINKLDDS